MVVDEITLSERINYLCHALDFHLLPQRSREELLLEIEELVALREQLRRTLASY